MMFVPYFGNRLRRSKRTSGYGENRIEVTAATQALAWRRAVEAARAVGMLGREWV